MYDCVPLLVWNAVVSVNLLLRPKSASLIHHEGDPLTTKTFYMVVKPSYGTYRIPTFTHLWFQIPMCKGFGMQIGILKRIAAAGQLSKALQIMQSQVLSHLEGNLKTASLIIEQLAMRNEKKRKQELKATRRPQYGNTMIAISRL